MDISLPDALEAFVDEQVAERGYETSSEYVRELIRRDRDRQHLRELLIEGASSAPGPKADKAYLRLAPSTCAPPSMRAKPVIARERASLDVDDAISFNLGEDAEDAALEFIDRRTPTLGSTRPAGLDGAEP